MPRAEDRAELQNITPTLKAGGRVDAPALDLGNSLGPFLPSRWMTFQSTTDQDTPEYVAAASRLVEELFGRMWFTAYVSIVIVITAQSCTTLDVRLVGSAALLANLVVNVGSYRMGRTVLGRRFAYFVLRPHKKSSYAKRTFWTVNAAFMLAAVVDSMYVGTTSAVGTSFIVFLWSLVGLCLLIQLATDLLELAALRTRK